MSSILQGVKNALRGVSEAESVNGLPSSSLSLILNGQNAKVGDATQIIAQLMQFSEVDRIRLDAAREVLNLHGVRKDEAVTDNRVQIVVQNYTPGNNNDGRLEQIFNPLRIVDTESEAISDEKFI